MAVLNVFFTLITILSGLLLYSPPQVYGQQAGFKYFKNYDPKEYNNHSQNWSILQDKRGLIYVGNQTGLMEFDGVSWRPIDIPNKTVRSMAMDDNGVIYIGGDNEIGFLAPGPDGTFTYRSLLDRLKKNEKDFSRVWRTHSTPGGVYFQTSKFIFRWDNGQMKVWPATMESPFAASFACGGKLYIRQANIGLRQMVNDTLTTPPGGETFADKKISMMVPYDPGGQKLLLGTPDNGFYIYDGVQAIPFPTEVDHYVKENLLSYGIRLSSSPGEFVAAANKGGIVAIDSHGRLKNTFAKTGGLLDDDVKYVFQDALGNLWLALNKGIAKIEYVSPFSIYDERSNLDGLVLSVVRAGSQNTLYAGATSGLYALDPGGKFQHIAGAPVDCFYILPMADSLLVAAGSGVIQVETRDNSPRKVTGNSSFFLLRSQITPNRTWVATREGLSSLTLSSTGAGAGQNGRWLEEHVFKEITREIRTIVEDEKGNLWLAGPPEGVLKVDFPGNGRIGRGGSIINPRVTWYDASRGLPAGEVRDVFTAAGHIMFTTGKGIYRFDEKTGSFLPDNTFGDEFAGGPTGRSVFRIAEDMDKNIWLNSSGRNIQAIRRRDGGFTINKSPFLRTPPAQVNVIYPDGNNVWFGGQDGLIRFDKTVKKNYRQDFATLIREVSIAGKRVFAGYEAGGGANPFTRVIRYKDRKNFHFQFAAPFFEAETATQYRTFLEGHDDDWSAWGPESKKDFTTLEPGSYTFRVQAKNVYEQPGREAVFHFKVLHPWYLGWWMFLFYALIFFSVLFLAVKWRSGKLEREKQKLEKVVKDRTKEIAEKNQQLETQTLRLKDQSEKLKEMDKVKSRFFANISHEFRTPLTLIMGPLESMIAGAGACSHDKDGQKSLNLMLRNSQRLLGLINQLLELSKFESGKVKLQASRHNIIPFLKGITASFEPVTAKNELDLTFYAQEENIAIYFDPGKLEELIFNLLSNAVKFTPPGGKITVAAAVNRTEEENFPSGSLDITISDTGPGIPRDQLAHIFDRFYQVENTHEHHHRGSGIGLSIAKELVELHHGKIDVHSHEGRGSEFITRLPMGKAHLEPHEIVESASAGAPAPAPRKFPAEITAAYRINPDIIPGTGGDAENEEVAAAAAAAAPDDKNIDPLKPVKEIILVVEDSADVRGYIRGALEPHYTIIEAKNGREGIQKALQIVPDLIISDIMMPEADGYELCRVLKNNIAASHIPIILLTAKASEESILEGLETGADDYITKPFNTRILCARIKNLIDLRRQMQLTLNREMTLQPVKISISAIDKKFIKKLQEVIKENISDPDFNIEQLCKKMEMSQPTIYRKIHALSGESPTEFIRSYRLKRGAELLKNNFGTVLEVAFEVGFASAGYFTKCFKEKFHRLPSSFQASEAE
ncbi:MAG: hybrid sensor histidine kinase/response regulator transcription factor [Candidatus Aminicenantes bacterium]|nr:hybrid sensor histidine kinase/response regulator transcription factor [Candidatus Aminicenantes bacterium]